MKLSACLLARNESPRIARAIRSVRLHCDEVVVLDTGSEDNTIDMARRAGADVIISEPWRTVDLGDGFRCLGNFADARNRVLNAAQGDWAVVVDCDHVFVPPTFAAIKQVMRDDSVHAGQLRYHMAKSQSARPADVVTGAKRVAQPFNSVALIRKHATDTEYYSGIIHEVTTPWLERRCREGTRHVVLMDSRVADYGHEASVRADMRKDERNRRLLEVAIKNDPDDPGPYTYLAGMYLSEGNQLQVAGDSVGAMAKFNAAADLVADVWDRIGTDQRLSGSHLLRLLATAGLLGFTMCQPELTWRAAQLWEENDARKHPDIDIIKGLAMELFAARGGIPGKGPDECLDAARAFYRVGSRRSADSVGAQHIVSDVAAERLAAIGESKPSLVMAG